MSQLQPQAILVLPQLRVQNANAISSPLTHGFPSITAITGLMWALQRKLAQAQIPLQLLSVGVVCHHHQEQVSQGFVRTFNLTRNPVDKDGSTAAIVEEGRMHLQLSLVFAVAEQLAPGTPSAMVQGAEDRMADWAAQVGDIAATMRVAGGSLLPSRPMPGKKVRPWMALLPEDATARADAFRQWRRSWLPGFALVGRDDLLADRLQHLQKADASATLLDAWLHASRFNHQVLPEPDGKPAADGRVRWGDLLRPKGSGWTVPIPVGYVALTPRHEAGAVANARDMATPLRFVESVYSMGEWISPHRLRDVSELLWRAEVDEAKGLYRCRNDYQPQAALAADGTQDDDGDEEDDGYVDD
ncbi:type I-F CRISPR-associated protein Csy2 [Comamonas fluminis]|uniref:type I-F CRISPR-associated protein Csy2 n=1 Tax=Comamonas fluminis TaxID=2796366 RepID=UPI001C45A994|nr:type I-F CRISPR-associated protein Csy2 [Comamonas fluminis]